MDVGFLKMTLKTLVSCNLMFEGFAIYVKCGDSFLVKGHYHNHLEEQFKIAKQILQSGNFFLRQSISKDAFGNIFVFLFFYFQKHNIETTTLWGGNNVVCIVWG